MGSLSSSAEETAKQPLRRGRSSSLVDLKDNNPLSLRARVLELKNSLLPALEIPQRSSSKEKGSNPLKNSAVPGHSGVIEVLLKSKSSSIVAPNDNEVVDVVAQQKCKRAESNAKPLVPTPTVYRSCPKLIKDKVQRSAFKREQMPFLNSQPTYSEFIKKDSRIEQALCVSSSKKIKLSSDIKQPIVASCAESLLETDFKIEQGCSGSIISTAVINSCAESTPSKERALKVEIHHSQASASEKNSDVSAVSMSAKKGAVKKSLFGTVGESMNTPSASPAKSTNANGCQIDQEADETMSQISSPFELSFFDELQEAKTNSIFHGVLNDTGVSSPLESSTEDNDEMKMAERRRLEILIGRTLSDVKKPEIVKKPSEPTITAKRKRSASPSTDEIITKKSIKRKKQDAKQVLDPAKG